VYLHMVRALFECGWQPKLDRVFEERDLITELKIKKECSKYFHFIMTIFEQEELLQEVGEQTWKLINLPPSPESIENTLSLPYFKGELVSKFKSVLLYDHFGQNLSGILKGTISAINVLFPDDNQKEGIPSVSDFYGDYSKTFKVGEFINKIGLERHANLTSRKFAVRILEVGAGTSQ